MRLSLRMTPLTPDPCAASLTPLTPDPCAASLTPLTPNPCAASLTPLTPDPSPVTGEGASAALSYRAGSAPPSPPLDLAPIRFFASASASCASGDRAPSDIALLTNRLPLSLAG